MEIVPIRNNRIWIEITGQGGFLFFGDLSRYQKKEGINISSNNADVMWELSP